MNYIFFQREQLSTAKQREIDISIKNTFINPLTSRVLYFGFVDLFIAGGIYRPLQFIG